MFGIAQMKKRIDYCLSNQKRKKQSSRRVFNGPIPLASQAQLQHRKIPFNTITERLPSERNSTRAQDLSVSDYCAFMKISKAEGKTDYPSSFQLIKCQMRPTGGPKKLGSKSFWALNCTRNELVQIFVALVCENKYCATHIGEKKLHLLATEIAFGYRDVSYHNFTHGFSLFKILYDCLKKDSGFASLYSSQETAYYLIAALAHDLAHPGTNNTFEVKKKSMLAVSAENDSVLQKFHIKNFFQLMKNNASIDVISTSSKPLETRRIITEAILATDISKHFSNLKILTEKRNNFQSKKDREFLMGQVIHASDIGNSSLEFDEYISWASLLTYEFDQQTKMEEQLGLEVTGFLKYKDIDSFYNEQNGFISKIVDNSATFVFPLWKELSLSFPGWGELVRQIQKNREAVLDLSKA